MGRKVEVSKVYSIANAAKYLEIGQATLRSAIKKGLLATVEAEVPGSSRTVTVIEKDALDAFKAKGLAKSRGNTKAFIVRIGKDQYSEIETLLAERGIALEPRSVYDAEKARAYRLARKADTAAELDDGDIEEWEDDDDTGAEGEDTGGDLPAIDETDSGTL